MRMWGLLFTGTMLALAAAASPAYAQEAKSFEELAKTAVPLSRADLGGMVWALDAACDDGDDLARRQCKAARDGRLAEIKGATLLVDGDAGAFQTGEWDPDTKSLPVVLRGCIACVEPVGGLYLVSSKAAPSFRGGSAEAALVHETTRTFKDERAAKRWAARAATMKTQMIVRVTVAADGRWERDGKKGLAFDVLGYRVWDPCDGGIVCASPASDKAPVDKKHCGEAVVESEEPQPKVDQGPELPAQLTAGEIKATMRPVADTAKDCFDTYGVPGKAKLVYAISGDGSILSYEQTGDFIDTPTGKCIDKAAKGLTFPKSKKKRFVFTYPLNVQ